MAALTDLKHSELRRARKVLAEENKTFPKHLVQLPMSRVANTNTRPKPICALRSRDFLVQVYQETNGVRLSVNRSIILPDGMWCDKITWDELQRLKREAGYGNRIAYEIYPADDNIVNVANMRHLWIPDNPPFPGWQRKEK